MMNENYSEEASSMQYLKASQPFNNHQISNTRCDARSHTGRWCRLRGQHCVSRTSDDVRDKHVLQASKALSAPAPSACTETAESSHGWIRLDAASPVITSPSSSKGLMNVINNSISRNTSIIYQISKSDKERWNTSLEMMPEDHEWQCKSNVRWKRIP